MQFPVVLKAERLKLTHKSDADAVRLGLTDGTAVAEAFEDFSRRLGAGPALLQRQAGPGAELILGARRDPLFGPMVMAGLGGVWTEILDDVALRLAPIEPDDVHCARTWTPVYWTLVGLLVARLRARACSTIIAPCRLISCSIVLECASRGVRDESTISSFAFRAAQRAEQLWR
jgi:ATP-grasp domain